MQPAKLLARTLSDLATDEHYLFMPADLRALFPDLSGSSFKALLSRAVSSGLLLRVCRAMYLYPKVNYPKGLVLFHTAARLRADCFNYISLETALSEAGIISQIPINWITLMSTGRSNILNCGAWGRIEFVHTARKPAAIADQLGYDTRCRLWRASVQLALSDMKTTRRNTDLIDWSMVHEPV